MKKKTGVDPWKVDRRPSSRIGYCSTWGTFLWWVQGIGSPWLKKQHATWPANCRHQENDSCPCHFFAFHVGANNTIFFSVFARVDTDCGSVLHRNWILLLQLPAEMSICWQSSLRAMNDLGVQYVYLGVLITLITSTVPTYLLYSTIAPVSYHVKICLRSSGEVTSWI